MADIIMCSGHNCPLKLSCYRHNAPKGMRQAYFMPTPFKDGRCSHYLEDKDNFYDWDATLNDGLNEEE